MAYREELEVARARIVELEDLLVEARGAHDDADQPGLRYYLEALRTERWHELERLDRRVAFARRLRLPALAAGVLAATTATFGSVPIVVTAASILALLGIAVGLKLALLPTTSQVRRKAVKRGLRTEDC